MEFHHGVAALLLFLLLALSGFAFIACTSPAAPHRLRVEFLENPIGLDDRIPRFSWTLPDSTFRQEACQIIVASTPERLQSGRADIWDSGKITSARNLRLPYGGPPLHSRQRCYWSARLWGADGAETPRSVPARWEMGLLATSDWQAKWVAPAKRAAPPAAYLIRKTFTLPAAPAQARAYVSSPGLFQLFVNGRRVIAGLPVPGAVAGDSTCLYRTLDVTPFLRAGENAIGALLPVAVAEPAGVPQPLPELLLQLEVQHPDGREFVVATDGNWQWQRAAFVRASTGVGESIDLRAADLRWSEPDFAAAGWPQVRELSRNRQLRSGTGTGYNIAATVQPVAVSSPDSGTFVVDFGQPIVGRILLQSPAEEARIALHYGGRLDVQGRVRDATGRPASVEDIFYTAAREDLLHPLFAVRGFRYVEVCGYPGALPAGAISAQPLQSVSPAQEWWLARLHPYLRRGRFLPEAAAADTLRKTLQMVPTLAAWQVRLGHIRRGILQGAGLRLLPRRTPLHPILHSRRAYDGYTVENLALETLPDFYLTANLYRPATGDGPFPAMLSPHGHFSEPNDGGRFRDDQQIRCATLARLGCIVLSYSMVGWGEAAARGWPHRSARTLALQLWNSIRAVDYLFSLPEVDTTRVGITGASGGGTQTFLLAAVDDRIALSVPVVMVSAHFFGGCSGESGLPIHAAADYATTNAEIAALAAPRPQLIVSVGSDWTRNVPEVEFPFIQQIYRLYGAPAQVRNAHFASETHNYGPSKRQAMYRFVIEKFGLTPGGLQQPDGSLDESDIVIEPPEQMYVFDAQHPWPPHAARPGDPLLATLRRH